LAEQTKGQTKGYYVLNDIFRYVDETPFHPPAGPSSAGPSGDVAKPAEVSNDKPAVDQPSPKVDSAPKSEPHPHSVSPQIQTPVSSQPKEIPATQTNSNNNLENHQPQKEIPKAEPKKVAPTKEKAPVTPSVTGPITWANRLSNPGQDLPAFSPPQVQKPIAAPTTQKQSPQQKKEGKGNASLFVRNISSNATEEDLKTLFSKYGEIKSLSFVQQKGIAFIDFATGDEAQLAINSAASQPLVHLGRPLQVEEKKDMKKSSDGKVPKDKRGSGGGTNGKHLRDPTKK
jgi:hypothetical protein